jgi:hypothetical protein
MYFMPIYGTNVLTVHSPHSYHSANELVAAGLAITLCEIRVQYC